MIGNKSDLYNKIVDFDSAKKLADAIGAPFLETSAKNNSDVIQAFLTMVESIKKTVEQKAAMECRGKVITLGGREHKEVDTSAPCWCM
jgi:Ras-related protein Rab-1A